MRRCADNPVTGVVWLAAGVFTGGWLGIAVRNAFLLVLVPLEPVVADADIANDGGVFVVADAFPVDALRSVGAFDVLAGVFFLLFDADTVFAPVAFGAITLLAALPANHLAVDFAALGFLALGAITVLGAFVCDRLFRLFVGVDAFAVLANLAVFAVLVFAALPATFWLIGVILFVAALLAFLAWLIAVTAVNNFNSDDIISVLATTTFDGD